MEDYQILLFVELCDWALAEEYDRLAEKKLQACEQHAFLME